MSLFLYSPLRLFHYFLFKKKREDINESLTADPFLIKKCFYTKFKEGRALNNKKRSFFWTIFWLKNLKCNNKQFFFSVDCANSFIKKIDIKRLKHMNLTWHLNIQSKGLFFSFYLKYPIFCYRKNSCFDKKKDFFRRKKIYIKIIFFKKNIDFL